MTSAWRASEMTAAQKIMFGFGLAALLVGGNMLAGRPQSEGARVARRLAGIMAIALGACLALFAIGLAGPVGG